jgi:5-carboxymethyl-2-hydroxymuconate isomerase
MPHLVLEYSANTPDEPDFGSVLARLHEALCATGPFDIAKVKSRVIRHEWFRVADGAPDRAFVHLTVAVLEGREPEVLHNAAGVMLGVLREAFPKSHAERRCDFTLEVREMPKQLYFKSW